MHIEYRDNGDSREYKLVDIHRVVEEITIQRAPEKYRDYQTLFDSLAINCLVKKAIYDDDLLNPVTEICQHIEVKEKK